jgi:hypothetical protein
MAKDYASFVKLILFRFSHIMPDWKEKSAADLTNVLIELLSYVGDHLSYYQDAVSTETYLGTAKRRISVKRHARLLDYFMNEGSNSRTWVCFEVDESRMEKPEGLVLKKSTKVLTGGEPTKGTENAFKLAISEDDFQEIVSQADSIVFETMHEVNLYSFHNEMFFYTWNEKDCCLPKGSTHATLLREVKNNIDHEEQENSLDIFIFTWETIEDNENHQKNLKNFMFQISSIFNKNDSITFIRQEDNNKIKMIDNNNPSKFISIELLEDLEYAVAIDYNNNFVYEFLTKKSIDNISTEIYGLSLKPGDVLIFEEKISPTTFKEEDKDPLHRQAVKLRKVERSIDPITNDKLVEIYWQDEDALRFPLCINKINTSKKGTNLENEESSDSVVPISVARGNVVLVDHGFTINNEGLEDVPVSGIYYPHLKRFPLTFASPFIPSASAYSSIYCRHEVSDNYNVPVLYPEILVREGRASVIVLDHHLNEEEEERETREGEGVVAENEQNELGVDRWFPRRDLLSSDRFAREFVVEIDNDSTPFLRFGDGKNGQKPQTRSYDTNNLDPVKFYATYRIGNGTRGNLGSETIKRIVQNTGNMLVIDKIKNIRNPLPAIGGTDQESLREVKQNAPVAFMRQERAVTEDDYVSVLKRHPEVQRAMAMFRWTGSWYTVYVTIDRFGGKIVDDSFKQEIYKFLNKFRLAGYDLEINSPIFVPLDIEINVCVKPNHYPDQVKRNLLQVFSTQCLQNGQMGFFHPDNFTFGQPLYLSKIYQTAMNVDGVESVFINRFQRMGKRENMELEKGIIDIHSSEIIRLDNDPNFPDNGKIEFVMKGGI